MGHAKSQIYNSLTVVREAHWVKGMTAYLQEKPYHAYVMALPYFQVGDKEFRKDYSEWTTTQKRLASQFYVFIRLPVI